MLKNTNDLHLFANYVANKNNFVIDNFDNDDDFDKLHEEIGEIKEINKLYKSNKLEKADKKVNINKQVQKIILSKNNDISNNSKITIGTDPKMKNDEISDYCDEEELEKEFQKYFN